MPMTSSINLQFRMRGFSVEGVLDMVVSGEWYLGRMVFFLCHAYYIFANITMQDVPIAVPFFGGRRYLQIA